MYEVKKIISGRTRQPENLYLSVLLSTSPEFSLDQNIFFPDLSLLYDFTAKNELSVPIRANSCPLDCFA